MPWEAPAQGRINASVDELLLGGGSGRRRLARGGRRSWERGGRNVLVEGGEGRDGREERKRGEKTHGEDGRQGAEEGEGRVGEEEAEGRESLYYSGTLGEEATAHWDTNAILELLEPRGQLYLEDVPPTAGRQEEVGQREGGQGGGGQGEGGRPPANKTVLRLWLSSKGVLSRTHYDSEHPPTLACC